LSGSQIKAPGFAGGYLLHQWRPRPEAKKLDGEGEARLVTLACSQPPGERGSWTLALLGQRLVELKIVDTIARETVRRTLKKTFSNRG
jgi:hypothetical protein